MSLASREALERRGPSRWLVAWLLAFVGLRNVAQLPAVERCEAESVQNALEPAIAYLRYWLVSLNHSRSYEGNIWSASRVNVPPNNDQTAPGDPIRPCSRSAGVSPGLSHACPLE